MPNTITIWHIARQSQDDWRQIQCHYISIQEYKKAIKLFNCRMKTQTVQRTSETTHGETDIWYFLREKKIKLEGIFRVISNTNIYGPHLWQNIRGKTSLCMWKCIFTVLHSQWKLSRESFSTANKCKIHNYHCCKSITVTLHAASWDLRVY